MMPPVAVASRNLSRRKTENQGTTAVAKPVRLCNTIDAIKGFFRPNLKIKWLRKVLPKSSGDRYWLWA